MLRPGLTDENFVAEAIGNLAAFELQRARGEPLAWQVIRVQGTGTHHFRLVVRHPTRALDLGIGHALHEHLTALGASSIDDLRQKLHRAEAEGLHLTRLRHVRESVDFWQDDFWNWMG